MTYQPSAAPASHTCVARDAVEVACPASPAQPPVPSNLRCRQSSTVRCTHNSASSRKTAFLILWPACTWNVRTLLNSHTNAASYVVFSAAKGSTTGCFGWAVALHFREVLGFLGRAFDIRQTLQELPCSTCGIKSGWEVPAVLCNTPFRSLTVAPDGSLIVSHGSNMIL